MRVREAEPADAAAIAAVHVRSWQGAYAHVFPAEALASLDVERRAAAWRDRRPLVAEDGDEIVGFAHVGPSSDEDGVGELYAIYVVPERWGSGVGRTLMERAVETLREVGFAEATLWVLDDNPRARRFYEAAGWRLDGAEKTDTFFDLEVREVRYRVSLR